MTADKKRPETGTKTDPAQKRKESPQDAAEEGKQTVDAENRGPFASAAEEAKEPGQREPQADTDSPPTPARSSDQEQAEREEEKTRGEMQKTGRPETTVGTAGMEEAREDEPRGIIVTAEEEPQQLQETRWPVVGIGASAGGLEALEGFLASAPENSGLTYVVISHTDPSRESMLPQLLQRETRIPVVQVREGMEVECDKVYLPPSNRELVLKGNLFHLQEAQRGLHPRLPIDKFLKSLAENRGELAACIILSGTGTDGTQGLRLIKEKGGVAMAQNEQSAKYTGMPQSAVDTGLVDFVLPPSEMPHRLVEYFSRATELRVKRVERQGEQQRQLEKIILFLANRTGHDFQYYKKSTLVRRIQRRMSVTRRLSMDHYRDYLYRNPEEIQALFQDLLIGSPAFSGTPKPLQSSRQSYGNCSPATTPASGSGCRDVPPARKPTRW